MTDKIVTDTFEAAYYMTYGAKIVDIRFRKVREANRHKLHCNVKWEFLMDLIPETAIAKWKSGAAVANVQHIRDIRLHIKDKVSKLRR